MDGQHCDIVAAIDLLISVDADGSYGFLAGVFASLFKNKGFLYD